MFSPQIAVMSQVFRWIRCFPRPCGQARRLFQLSLARVLRAHGGAGNTFGAFAILVVLPPGKNPGRAQLCARSVPVTAISLPIRLPPPGARHSRGRRVGLYLKPRRPLPNDAVAAGAGMHDILGAGTAKGDQAAGACGGGEGWEEGFTLRQSHTRPASHAHTHHGMQPRTKRTRQSIQAKLPGDVVTWKEAQKRLGQSSPLTHTGSRCLRRHVLSSLLRSDSWGNG